MREIERICAAVRFTAESMVALESAANLARAFDARLDVVSVVQPPPLYQRVLNPIQSRLLPLSELEARAREKIQNLAQGEKLVGLKVESRVLVGRPFVELITDARENRASLMVVGARSRSDLAGAFLGSTAERVLRKSPIPVLIAKAAVPREGKLLLAATDLSAASRPAMELAILFARRWIARLVLLHVIEPITQTYVWPAEPATAEIYPAEPEEMEPEWREFLSGLDLKGVRWETSTAKGYAAATIAVEAQRRQPDLLVLGTHGRSGIAHALLGSVAEAVSREADCPVLITRPEAFEYVAP